MNILLMSFLPFRIIEQDERGKMIKLFVSCHKRSDVPEHPLLQPIQVGTELAHEEFLGFLHDNTGDNISAKNQSYCELTAQYWAWKNYDADYYGFFHYRRYLYPDLKPKLPYRLEKELSLQTLQRLRFDTFEDLIPQYDIIMPKAEDMHVSVRDHYACAPYHHARDLQLAESIVSSLWPSYIPAMEMYFSQTSLYFGNIFIMGKPMFHNYCTWLFPVLEEFDRESDCSDYSTQELRVDGYLAERLLGIFFLQNRQFLKTLELPRVHFYSGREYAFQRMLNFFLPPGSRRRAEVKYLQMKRRENRKEY